MAWVGLTEDEAKKQGIKFEKGVFPCRLRPRHRQWPRRGLHQADLRRGYAPHPGRRHRGTHAGDLISEVALAVEMGADVIDIAKTIHPHPTLGESVGMAAKWPKACTDLPPMKKK